MATLKVDMGEVKTELATLKRELLKRTKEANLKKGDWAYKYKVSKAMWAKFEAYVDISISISISLLAIF